jgi:hypothetical protein
MTNSEFQTVCGIALIDPDIALKNEAVQDFLKKNKRDSGSITSQLILTGILKTEF